MRGDIFKGIMQWEFPQTAKHIRKKTFKLPVFYYDTTSMTAIYTASTATVKKFMPHPDLYPLELTPGRCMIAFSAFEYRKTDIGPYNEFSIAVLVTRGKKGIPGLSALGQMRRKCFHAWVWHLPVTTEIARYGGVELYGYPKFLAGIAFKRSGAFLECELTEGKKRILTLKGPVLPVKYGGRVQMKTYPVRNGVLLCGNVCIDNIEFAEARGGKGVELRTGADHPICRELSAIDLGRSAVVYQYSPVNEGILFGPRNLIDD